MTSSSAAYASDLTFVLNGKEVHLEHVDPTLLLIDYLRSMHVGLTGTKLVCGEGGCGACTVVIARKDRRTGQVVERPINACLHLSCMLDGTVITTTEGLGSTKTQLHPIQAAIADGNGSQCGFCTPGWVMTMYGLLRNTPQPTPQEVEDYFGGNLCRCTGYRPILDALQSFARDHSLAAQAAGQASAADDFQEPRPLYFEGGGYKYYRPLELSEVLNLLLEFHATQSNVKLLNGNTSIGIYKQDEYDPKVLIDVSQIIELTELGYQEDSDAGIVVGGGITIAALKDFLANVNKRHHSSRTRGLVAFEKHLARMAGEQVRSAASVAGNLMLAINHERQGTPFPSDLMTVLTALDATVVLRSPEEPEQDQHFPIWGIPMDKFPRGFVIMKVLIPFTQKNTLVQTYKVARRLQNSHALVNAGFQCTFDPSTVVTGANLVFGGINRMVFRAAKTGSFLQGKPWTHATYKAAVKILRRDIEAALVPMPDDGVASEYRLGLAESLFFKYFVYVASHIAPQEIPEDEKSAGQPWVRPISRGKHGFVQAPYYQGEPLEQRTSSVSMHPGTMKYAMLRAAAVRTKIDSSKLKHEVIAVNVLHPASEDHEHSRVNISARSQATGEAQYTQDMLGMPGLLHAAYVYSTCQDARFDYGPQGPEAILTDLHSQWPGFVAYITANDIPNKSDRGIYNDADPASFDPIFASDRVTAYGQPIGLVVADTLANAKRIAAQIQGLIRYDRRGIRVVTTIEQAVAEPKGRGILTKQAHIEKIERPNSDQAWLENPHPEPGKVFVKGTQRTGGQAHFYLETQTTLAVPGEMGKIVLYSSSQDLGSCQSAVAGALNLHASKVEVRATRLGGGYGGKEVRPPLIAAAAAVAAWKLNRPVRLALDRNTDMTMIGGRHPFKGKYYLSADPSGRIEKIRFDFWSNAGFSYDCSLPVMDLVLLSADGAYNIDTFQANGTACRTNMATNTAFRSFGVIQCSLILEEAIEQLAYRLGMTPEAVREVNLYRDATADSFDLTPYGQELRYSRIREVWADLKEHAKFKKRLQDVEAFNAANRWRKRGIAMIPIKYGISYTYMPMNQGSAEVLVYTDGSVLVHHGGVEMGQGIDTKILQIAAETLGIDPNLIQIDHSDTSAVANAVSTGASTGTDLQGGAVRAAAKQLRERLVAFCEANQADPKIIPPNWRNDWAESWTQIVQSANTARVDLSSEASFDSPNLGTLQKNGQLLPGQQMFYYFTYSAAVSEVEIDVLTGEFSILRSDIIYDAGQSINPTLDVGQVQGGFVQGVGNVTTEQMYYAEDGKPYSNGTWNYKPPCSKTIPVEFNVSLLEYVRTDHRTGIPMDKYGIMSSKSTGEPPLVLANSVFFAIKHAIMAARQAAGWQKWFELESPATVERIRQACWVR